MAASWITYAFIAAIITAAASIVEKKTLNKQHAMEFSAALSIFIMIISIPFLLIAQYNDITLTKLGIIYATSIFGAVAFLFIAKATRHLAISITSPFTAFGPLFTAIIAAVILKEHLTLMQTGGLLVLVVGAYILESHPHQKILEPFRYIFKSRHIKYIFFALILYGFSSVFDKKILGAPIDGGLGVPVMTYLPLVHFFIAINFIIMMIFFHDGFKGISAGIKHNWKWIFVAAVLTISYRFSQQVAIAMPGVLVSLVVPIKRMSALFSTIVGGEMFHEDHILRKSLACVIMIIGTILILI